jgi:hypothetical protein
VKGERNVERFMRDKPEGRRQLVRRRHTCKDNIKLNLKETGWEGIKWINVAEDANKWRVVFETLANLEAPRNAENFLTR